MQPDGIPIDQFCSLNQEFGSPRLLILNACESFAGKDLNPFLGAALQCVPRFETAIAMQTKVPVAAAMRFAQELIRLLADNVGLAHSMKKARLAMLRNETGLRPITRFIPVLMQRTSQDHLFAFDLSAQMVERLRKLLAMRLDQIDRLPRRVDQSLVRVLTGEGCSSHVAIVTGPLECGKSVAVQGAIDRLLEPARIEAGERYLYFAARGLKWQSEVSTDLRQLLYAFVREFEELTTQLKDTLNDVHGRDSRELLLALATWFDGEFDAGRKVTVIFDQLPEALLTDIATRLHRVLSRGRLLLVSSEDAVPAQVSIERVSMEAMTLDELTTAVPNRTPEEIDSMFRETGGNPSLVVLRLRGQGIPDHVSAEIVSSFSIVELKLMQFAALSTIPLTADVLTDLDVETAVLQGLALRRAAIREGEGWVVPGIVGRAVIRDLSIEERADLRLELFNAFSADGHRSRADLFRRHKTIRLYREAFDQGIAILSSGLDPDALGEVAEATKQVALEMHYQLMELGQEPDEALATWDAYNRAMAIPGGTEDREVLLRMARCLAAVGRLDEADEMLRQMLTMSIDDEIQIRAHIVRSDVLKRLARDGASTLRRAVLEDALAVHGRVHTSLGSQLADELLGDIEQSRANVLGYGGDADVRTAIEIATRAAEIFERLKNDRRFRARAEVIEIQRYNHCLSDEARQDGIATLRMQAEKLLECSMQEDAVRHLYELGRLETDPRLSAHWFQRAVEHAEGRFAPMRLHANIRWLRAEVDAGLRMFADAAPLISRACEELASRWSEDGWSRRVRRDALLFLAKEFGQAGDEVEQRAWLEKAHVAISEIQRYGEGRRDREIRERTE